MKHVIALALVFGSYVPSFAQADISGEWDVTERPVRIVLSTTGSTVTGTVGGQDIVEGRVDGNTVSLTWRSPDGDRTITVTGQIQNDQIAFTRARLDVREGGTSGGNGFHGGSGPQQFTAKRVGSGLVDAKATLTAALGREFSAAVNLVTRNVKAEGRIFVPPNVARAPAVIVFIRWGNGSLAFDDQAWRTLAEQVEAPLVRADFSTISTPTNYSPAGAVEALPLLLQRLGGEFGYSQLADVPLVLWGHSAAGVLVSLLANAHGPRVIAFMGYHSGSAGGAYLSVLSQIPALLLAGGKDVAVAPGTVEGVWRRGRAAGALWTYSVDPNADHASTEALTRAGTLMIPWLKAVIGLRVPASGGPLRSIAPETGWLGDARTNEVATRGLFGGNNIEAVWLPDEASAQAWNALALGR